MFGDKKLKQDNVKKTMQISSICAEIEKAHNELIHIVVNNSKYDLQWLLSQNIFDFYQCVKMIEKDIKTAK